MAWAEFWEMIDARVWWMRVVTGQEKPSGPTPQELQETRDWLAEQVRDLEVQSGSQSR